MFFLAVFVIVQLVLGRLYLKWIDAHPEEAPPWMELFAAHRNRRNRPR